MTDKTGPPSETLRDDILVSVCFSALSPTEAAFDKVRAVARRVDARFRFREIVVVADATNHEAFLPLVRSEENVRLFAVRPGSSYYYRRVLAAEEAIGDVVLIADEDEIEFLDPVAIIERAASEDRAIIGIRPVPGTVRRWMSAPVVALGRTAGLTVNPRNLRTIALPRTLLNQILSHSDPELALRFPPRDPRLPLSTVVARPGIPPGHEIENFGRWLHLGQKLVVYLAPSLLLFVTLASSLLTLLGIAYAIYVIGAWIVVDDLAPGWLTTSSMLSLTAFFLGISILGISLGLQKVLAAQRKDSLESVAQEVNRVDLFGEVASELNVELEQDDETQADSGASAKVT